MKKQPRVAIYHRTNHLHNRDALDHLVAYTEKIDLEPIIIFVDIGSGAGYRSSLSNLLNHVRNKKVDSIIAHSLSRFSRKTSEVAAILSELEKYNVKLIIPNDRMEVAYHE